MERLEQLLRQYPGSSTELILNHRETETLSSAELNFLNYLKDSPQSHRLGMVILFNRQQKEASFKTFGDIVRGEKSIGLIFENTFNGNSYQFAGFDQIHCTPKVVKLGGVYQEDLALDTPIKRIF